jgi:hypothetical protein
VIKILTVTDPSLVVALPAAGRDRGPGGEAGRGVGGLPQGKGAVRGGPGALGGSGGE